MKKVSSAVRRVALLRSIRSSPFYSRSFSLPARSESPLDSYTAGLGPEKHKRLVLENTRATLSAQDHFTATTAATADSRRGKSGNRRGGRVPKLSMGEHPKVVLSELINIPRISSADVNKIVQTYSAEMEMVEIVSLIFSISKHKNVVLSKKNIRLLAKRMKSIRPHSMLQGPQIGKIMYGMKNFSSADLGTREMLLETSKMIDDCEEELSGQTIANMMYGLCGMKASHSEVRFYLRVLAKKFTQNVEPLKYFEIGSAMYGMRNMDSSYKEVQDVLYMFGRKIESSHDMFTSQVISNCLYGMKLMSCKHDAVKYMVSVIRYKIETSKIDKNEGMNAQCVGNALYGLQNMSSESLEVKRLLCALAPKISECTQSLSAQAVGNALFGLRGMSSNYEEVRRVITALSPMIQHCPQKLSVQNLDNSLIGMQRMSSEHEEVRAIVSALASKFTPRTLDSHACGSTLFGMRRMKCEHDEVRALLAVIDASLPVPPAEDVKILANNISISFSGLQYMRETTPEVDAVLRKLHQLFVHCKDSFKIGSLCNILFGLQNMKSDSSAVQNILSAVSSRCSQQRAVMDKEQLLQEVGVLTAPSLGKALLGLQHMSSAEREVRAVAQQLAELLESQFSAEGCLAGEDVRRILRGLRGMSSEHGETRSLLGALADRMSGWGVDCELEAGVVKDLVDACDGLDQEHEEVVKFLNALSSLPVRTDESHREWSGY